MKKWCMLNYTKEKLLGNKSKRKKKEKKGKSKLMREIKCLAFKRLKLNVSKLFYSNNLMTKRKKFKNFQNWKRTCLYFSLYL